MLTSNEKSSVPKVAKSSLRFNVFIKLVKILKKIVFTELHFKLYRGHHVVLLNLKTNRYISVISKQNKIVVFDENLTICVYFKCFR